MVHFNAQSIDLSFAALSDPTRRGVIEHLCEAPASISVLAEKFSMTLTGMKKHVTVLEQAGLVATQKIGRTRMCRLGERGLEAEARWIEAHRKLFEARFAALDDLLENMKKEEDDGSKGD